jgi:hypothetical protein
MVVLLSCPWCDGDVTVEESELAGEVRCAECSVAFSFGTEARTDRQAEAA